MASERESVAEQHEERGANISVVEKGKEEEKREGGERQGRQKDSCMYGEREKERGQGREREWRGRGEQEIKEIRMIHLTSNIWIRC